MLSRLAIQIRLLLLLAVPLAALLIVALGGLASINATSTTTEELQRRLDNQSHLEAIRDSVRADLLETAQGVAASRVTTLQALERVAKAKTHFDADSSAYLAGHDGIGRKRAEDALRPLLDRAEQLRATFENALADNNISAIRAMSGDTENTARKVFAGLNELLAQERSASDRL